MSIRFGVSPIAWANDDMPELGGGTPDQLATMMRVQADAMIKLAKEAGIKPVD